MPDPQEQVRYLHRNPPTIQYGDGNDVFSDRPSPVGQWVHVVAVRQGGEARLYLNGELVQLEQDDQPVATDLPITFCVGVSPVAATPDLVRGKNDFRPFAGSIDEVAVYDSALSEQTIRTHYQLGRSNME